MDVKMPRVDCSIAEDSVIIRIEPMSTDAEVLAAILEGVAVQFRLQAALVREGQARAAGRGEGARRINVRACNAIANGRTGDVKVKA